MKTVAILTGGTSAEREIALLSAKTVAEALAPHFDVRVFDFPKQIDDFLRERNGMVAAVPVFHGRGGEDGTVQGFLKTLNIPFIFSNVEAHAIGMNKLATKTLASRAGVGIPGTVIARRGSIPNISVPAVVKPVDAGSSVGVTIVKSTDQLPMALAEAFRYSDQVFVEPFIAGVEYTVGVINEGGTPTALPVIEIRPTREFFDYQSKYDTKTLAAEICPAPISADLTHHLQDAAVSVHRILRARHLSRSDFIIDAAQKIWFLEINTIPGLTKNSLVPKALRVSGRDLGTLLKGWVETAAFSNSRE